MQELAGMLLMDMSALKCARELDLVKALAIQVLGKVTDEELSTILAKRAQAKAAATADLESELLLQENLDNVECILDDDDMEGVHAEKKRA